MQYLEKEEIKEIQLALLDYIDETCKKHDIPYFLSYGTMLGAIRHKGMIPWDDDIDIMMPRDDYNRFIKLYNDHNPRYQVYSIENDDSYTYTMAKVFDQETVMIDNTLWRNFDKDPELPDDLGFVRTHIVKLWQLMLPALLLFVITQFAFRGSFEKEWSWALRLVTFTANLFPTVNMILGPLVVFLAHFAMLPPLSLRLCAIPFLKTVVDRDVRDACAANGAVCHRLALHLGQHVGLCL